MTIGSAQKVLGVLWLLATVVFVAVIFGIVAAGSAGDRSGELGKWAIPYVVPTATLIIGVLVQKFRDRDTDEPLHDRFLFILAMAFLGLYFLALFAVVVYPFATGRTDVVEFITNVATVFLTPLQGLTTAILGAFFVQSKKS